MPPWEEPLRIVCSCLIGSLGEPAIPFLIVGSVASELQGCIMGTRDLDILFTSEDDLKRYTSRIASCMLQPQPVISCQSFDSGFKWYKAQNEIGGFLVDAVYIASGGGIPDSITGDGAWEGGPYAWRFARAVQFREYQLQAAPLEIQLESQIRRGRLDRAEIIAERLRTTGFDPTLLEQCLSRESHAAWAKALRPPTSA
jgi:hypothetical protein